MSGGEDNGLTVRCKVHFHEGHKGQLEMRAGAAPEPCKVPAGRVPKLSRLMALAIKFQGMLERGEVKDQAELARVGHVTRARVTQVMNLLMLAPDIQEQILFLPLVADGRDPVKEWQVRVIAAEPVWEKQRKRWLRAAHFPRLAVRRCADGKAAGRRFGLRSEPRPPRSSWIRPADRRSLIQTSIS